VANPPILDSEETEPGRASRVYIAPIHLPGVEHAVEVVITAL